MKISSDYTLGQSLRDLLEGFLQSRNPPSTSSGLRDERAVYGAGWTAEYYGNQYGAPLPEATDVAGMFNQACTLYPGNLLVVHQADNTVYQVYPDTGEIEFVVQLRHLADPFLWSAIVGPDGLIYCSLGGTKRQHGPFKYAVGDDWGAIVRLNHKLARVETLALGEHLKCPAGIEFMDAKTLLVCAPSGFGRPGRVYSLDIDQGRLGSLIDGFPLSDPVTATMESDGSIWIANSDQPSQDGELLLYRDGRIEIAIPKQGPGTGALVGVCQTGQSDLLAIVRLDWPNLQSSSVSLFNKTTRVEQFITRATPREPTFYTDSCVSQGEVIWFGEAYRRKIIAFNTRSMSIENTIDFSPVLGNTIGMRNSYNGIENISIIPGAPRE